MKTFFLSACILFLFNSCRQQNDKSTDYSLLLYRLDSINHELKMLNETSSKDTIFIEKAATTNDTKNIKANNNNKKIKPPTKPIKTEVETPKESPKPKPIPQKTLSEMPNDTIYHRFKDGRISVKVAPRADKQMIWIYKPQGYVIYTLENVRMSYSISNTLHFRTDGSLEKVTTSTNPGASMYMYKTTTHFDQTNEPTYKIEEKWPSTLAEMMDNTWLWKSNEKRWIKQTVAEETEIPKVYRP
jgi:hypothetical protein